MTEVNIKIPQEIKSIIGDIDEPLYIEALREIARKKLKEKKLKLKRMKRKIERFEKHYGENLDQFSRNLSNTKKAHDDWMDWTFLEETASELQSTIEKLERMLSQ